MVGLDGSDVSWRALDAAAEIAVASGGALTAVHADHLPRRAAWGFGSSLGETVVAEEELETKLAAELRERNSREHLEIGLIVVKDKPADALIAAADRVDADLIVVGHAGAGGAHSWLGSVSNAVVHRATRSVLVVR